VRLHFRELLEISLITTIPHSPVWIHSFTIEKRQNSITPIAQPGIVYGSPISYVTYTLGSEALLRLSSKSYDAAVYSTRHEYTPSYHRPAIPYAAIQLLSGTHCH
jgi:hypothetical protein